VASAVRAAGDDAEAMAPLVRLYRQVDAALADIQPACRACGSCCDFPAHDHRLYVSTGELAYLLQSPPAEPAAARAGRCPYQQHSRCTARPHRALGCRTYTCDADAAEAANAVYARFHARIQALHDTHHVPYFYGELTAMWRAVRDPPR